VFALALVVGYGSAADAPGKAVKAQMVKGTIKVVDPAKALLIVNQKLTKDGKTSVVDRELSILPTTAFDIDGKEYVGKEALQELVGKEGASVQVKCDKDVNVLKVTVKGKK
jgi:hypothetical protein